GPVQDLLKSFIVPLKRGLADMMGEANRELAEAGHLSRWDEGTIAQLRSEEEVYVLVDRGLLQEILKNVCANVRYQERPGQAALGLEYRIRRVRQPEVESELEERTQYVRVEIFSRGEPFQGDSEPQHRISTLAKEKHEILEYGGRLELKSIETGAVAILTLISRHAERSIGLSA